MTVTGFLAGTRITTSSGELPIESLLEGELVTTRSGRTLRARMAQAAYHDVLWRYGPERRADMLQLVLDQHAPGKVAARAFELELRRAAGARPGLPLLPACELLHRTDRLGAAEATIVVPVYNYARYVIEALESARRQQIDLLDLVVVDDASTDESCELVLEWAARHAKRFNRLLVLRAERKRAGAQRGLCRGRDAVRATARRGQPAAPGLRRGLLAQLA